MRDQINIRLRSERRSEIIAAAQARNLTIAAFIRAALATAVAAPIERPAA